MKKITRTIEFTVADILIADTTTREMHEELFTLPGVFSSEKEILKEIKTNDDEYAIKVVSSATHEKKFTISLEDFIKYATEIKED